MMYRCCDQDPKVSSNYDGYGPFKIECLVCGRATRRYSYESDNKIFEELAGKAFDDCKEEWENLGKRAQERPEDVMFEMLTSLMYQLTDNGWVDRHGHTIEKNDVYIAVKASMEAHTRSTA